MPGQEPCNAASGHALGLAERLALVYERAAQALEHSAALAEAHADGRQTPGISVDAEQERYTARRAQDAAQRARAAARRA